MCNQTQAASGVSVPTTSMDGRSLWINHGIKDNGIQYLNEGDSKKTKQQIKYKQRGKTRLHTAIKWTSIRKKLMFAGPYGKLRNQRMDA